MHPHAVRKREYLEARLTEEMERGWRYGRGFTLLIFKRLTGTGDEASERLFPMLSILAPLVRAPDILAIVDDYTIVALLVETDALGTEIAVHRFSEGIARLPKWEPQWDMTVLAWPVNSSQIEALPFFVAA